MMQDIFMYTFVCLECGNKALKSTALDEPEPEVMCKDCGTMMLRDLRVQGTGCLLRHGDRFSWERVTRSEDT